MADPHSDSAFTGSVPEAYERFLVPLIFESYAADLVGHLRRAGSRNILEVAAGTGVLTRAMAAGLDESVSITSTDLNRAMLDHAETIGASRSVTWQEADVMHLPYADSSFDTVVCQFGVMFFPDRPKAFAEIRRVLCTGGLLLFNTWDRIEANDFANVVTDALAGMYPDNPPRFLPRAPHAYHDEELIRAELIESGFPGPARISILEARSKAASCEHPAIAYCQGTPLRSEILALDPDGLGEATEVASAAIAERFGRADVDGRIRGMVISEVKP